MANSQYPYKLLYITTVPETLYFHAGQSDYMQQRGFGVCALSSSPTFPLQLSKREPLTLYEVEMLRQITPSHDLRAVFQIWRHLHRIRPAIVHASTPKGGLLGTIAAWLAGVPARIYHMRGLPFVTATGYKRFLLWWSEKVACLLADRVLCVSHSLREVAVSEGLCPAAKIKVLLGGSSNGVDAIDRFNPERVGVSARSEVRQRYRIPKDALVVGFAGRVVQDKGISELMQAWKTLREEFSNLHLLVVGPFESQDPIAQEMEHILRQDSRIHLTDRVSNLAPFYRAMDVLTLPTYREGFPNTPLEAAAMQLPVVATQIPGCVDAVQDGVTGTLVPPRDAEALADAIRAYLKEPELRQQHGLAGRDRVLRDFRQEAIWQALHEEYLQLLQEKGLLASSYKSNIQEMVL